MLNFLFGGAKPEPVVVEPVVSPEAQLKARVKGWQANLRKEMSKVDRSVAESKRTEAKLVAEIKDLSKKGRGENAKQVAKSLCQIRKHLDRMGATKGMLNSLVMQLGEHMAMVSIVGVLSKSSDIVKTMMDTMRNGDPTGTQAVRLLEDEMLKANFLNEQITEGIDNAMPAVEEGEIEDEVNATLFQLSNGALGTNPAHIEAAKQQQRVQTAAAGNAALMALVGGGGGGQ